MAAKNDGSRPGLNAVSINRFSTYKCSGSSAIKGYITFHILCTKKLKKNPANLWLDNIKTKGVSWDSTVSKPYKKPDQHFGQEIAQALEIPRTAAQLPHTEIK
jgi:hypothetical protein